MTIKKKDPARKKMLAATKKRSDKRLSKIESTRQKKTATTKGATTLQNKKREAFAHEYVLNGNNGTQAYLAAGYNCTTMSAWSLAHRLLRNIEVQARVKELQNQYHEKLTHSREQLIQEIDKLAFIDPIEFVGDDGEFLPLHLMSEHARKSVQEISAIAGNGTEEGMKILNAKWGRDRGRYIDMLGKIHNVFERHAGAGSGVIIVQQYCEADAHL